MYYYDNEDAGDLSAYNEAEYYAEKEANRAHYGRLAFREQWDHDMRGPVAYYDPELRETITVTGPMELPECERCGSTMDRNTDGRVGPYAVLLCSDECLEHERERNQNLGFSEGREFPTYG